MAVAMDYVDVFKVLMADGFITATHYTNGRKRTYNVITKSGGPLAGHITEKQFARLLSANVITEISPKPSKDDDGNIYYYYHLTTKE